MALHMIPCRISSRQCVTWFNWDVSWGAPSLKSFRDLRMICYELLVLVTYHNHNSSSHVHIRTHKAVELVEAV